MKKWIGISSATVILGVIIFFLVCNFNYSDGKRAGVLVKFSRKGFVMKTYEGDLNLGGVNPMPGNTIANNIWKFSVNDKKVAQQLMELEGQKVKLHYKQKLKIMPWQGDTPYLVDAVSVIEE